MSTLPVIPNRRILVIDDNRAIHEDFRKILGPPPSIEAELASFEASLFGVRESVWYDIDCASQGDEGLRKVEQAVAEDRPFALAFVDIRMPPGWDGVETTRRIWEVCPDLQIVICTAYSDYSWEAMHERVSPGDRMLILKKPFDAIEVQQLANSLTEKWRMAREYRGVLKNLDGLVHQRTAELQSSRAAALEMMEEAVRNREKEERVSASLQLEMAERQKLEEKFRDQASLLDLARDAILVRDMNDQVTYWNRSAEALYGWNAAEVAGNNVRELLRMDPVLYASAGADVLKNGEWTGEIHQTDRNGRALQVESRWTLVRDAEGQAKAVMAINTDVTEKKRMEAHYLRSQRMESIGTLAGGIAHDLNNVLLPIMLSIDLLRLTVEDKAQLGILSTIETSARRGAHMVQQVLSFARGIEGERHYLDARSASTEIRNFVQETFPKNIQFNARVPEGLPGFLGDATHVHQVLLNLFVNARDAMPDGGVLTFTAKAVSVDETYAPAGVDVQFGQYLCLDVIDTGSGIPDGVRDKIFDPFFTTKELGKGTGLGLSTVMAIVKSHGGFIHVESEAGKGTSFHVHFPVAAAPGAVLQETAPDQQTKGQGQGQLVLVVDDELSVRTITSQALEAFGYRVLTAENGVEAIALYAEHLRSIDVVLTDMMMPVMDGPTTISILKQMNPRVKIVAASGLNAGAVTATAIGVSDFLRKPYTTPAMLKALEHAMHEDGQAEYAAA